MVNKKGEIVDYRELMHKMDNYTAPPVDGDHENHTQKAIKAVYNILISDFLKLQDENKKLRQYLGKYDGQVSYYKSELAGSWLYLAEEVKQYLKDLEK